jgi:hypothetical protein
MYDVSLDDATRIAKRDFGQPNAADILSVQLAVNTWQACMLDCGVGSGAVLDMRTRIIKCGLTEVHAWCKDVCSVLLDSLATGEDITSTGYSLVKRFSGQRQIIAHITEVILRSTPPVEVASHYSARESAALHCALQVLCYLDRFTFSTVDENKVVSSLDKFKDANRLCKQYEYDWSSFPGSVIRYLVTDEFLQLLPEPLAYNIYDANFSSGSVCDPHPDVWRGHQQTKLGKFYSLARYELYYCKDYRYPYPLHSGYDHPVIGHYPRLQCVPKSFGGFRVIAPESAYNSFMGGAALEALRRSLTKSGAMRYINERDQSVNRTLALDGSSTGSWATIDLSSASDTISKVVFHSVVPRWYSNFISRFESDWVEVPCGNNYYLVKLHTLFTSGNRLTWLNEAVYFLAIARAAAKFCAPFVGKSPNHVRVFAFGDDLIVPEWAYDTVLDFLRAFGHIVNDDKSYNTGQFRESCGIWAYRGEVVTPLFWPRAVLEDKAHIVLTSADLQHKAILSGYPRMADCCAEFARTHHRTMTTSSVGSPYADLWDAEKDEWFDSTHRHTRLTEGTVVSDYDDLAAHVAYYQHLQYGPLYLSEEDLEQGISSSRLQELLTSNEGKRPRLVP